MTYETDGQMSWFDLDTESGKTSPELSPRTGEKTSVSSSKSSAKSKTVKFQFLDLRKASGTPQVSSWVTDSQSLGELWMHSSGAFLRDGEEYPLLLTSTDRPQEISSSRLVVNLSEAPNIILDTHLSDILEVDVDPRYHLSAKACQGILNRAERRGKVLPELLREALMQTISRSSQLTERENKGGAKDS